MKGLLIYNPKSGKLKKKHLVYKLVESLSSFFEYLEMFEINKFDRFADDAKALIKKVDIVLIAGGDGTIHTVVNLIMTLNMEKPPAILPLPFGTSNDIATMLGISQNVEDILHILTQKSFEEIDIIKVNHVYAVYAIAAGKYTNVSYAAPRWFVRWFGITAYWCYLLVDMFKCYNQKITIEYDDKVVEMQSFLLIGALTRRMGGFNLHKFPNKVLLNDGIIDLVCFRSEFLGSMKAAHFYLKNGYVGDKNLVISTNELKIKMGKPWIWNLDGERSIKGDVCIKVMPKAIRIYGNAEKIEGLFKKGVI